MRQNVPGMRRSTPFASTRQPAHGGSSTLTAGVHRTYVEMLERGGSGVTVEALAAILAPLGISLSEFFKPFKQVVRPRVPRRQG